MKIAILDTYYPAFLAARGFTGNSRWSDSYNAQLDMLMGECFGTSDFYSRHLRRLGCDAVELIANCIPLQRAWARENGYAVSEYSLSIDHRITRIPLIGGAFSRVPGLIRIASEQVKRLKPDILYCQDMSFLPPSVLHDLKNHVRLLVGQIASPAPNPSYLRCYDLILTSFPHFVQRFRDLGLSSEYFRIGFDTRVLDLIGRNTQKDMEATFVGGISTVHSQGTYLLEKLAKETPIQIFGYGLERLPMDSAIRARHRGEVWGKDMYRTLARSRITLNRHINVAEDYANNMRLFEATGVGAMLLTDMKTNLNELFVIGNEAVAYSSPDEAVELLRHYLEHPADAAVIAAAGQRRTLHEHTYAHRMEELMPILQNYLSKSRR